MGIRLPDPLPTAESKAQNQAEGAPDDAQIKAEIERHQASLQDEIDREMVSEDFSPQRRRVEDLARSLFRPMTDVLEETRRSWNRRHHDSGNNGEDTTGPERNNARRRLAMERFISPYASTEWRSPNYTQSNSAQPQPPTRDEYRACFLWHGDVRHCIHCRNTSPFLRSDPPATETHENNLRAQRARQRARLMRASVFNGSSGAASERPEASERDLPDEQI
ncbi:hypothetical protein P170DRAFT_512939 [Aspergillus steynii IBT 23096]|uniref:Uncharacterized protein n=1 Tax=Aspergillus steynii IBT 23096 TaxID=1392250 RepID=A0A2I2FVY2_9EURO|nr:uncharacterized protein P170DRAFT_512939 [Aspergillus steynii IBT 23096]PLB44791.1 hypothetical protein P170DRAFT_512939 [Aspergillus steynii IBT 23096]